MKRRRLIALVVALAVALGAGGYFALRRFAASRGLFRGVTVGFVYDNDEHTPYSHNFMLAQEAVQSAYQGRVKVLKYSSVAEEDITRPMEELAGNGCEIIFTNGYGKIRDLAKQHPEIQFCQVSSDPYPDSEALPNYHTFKGEIYQGRYASGVVAGMKLRQMIEDGTLAPEAAKVGFVAAYPYAEVISGYTAFLLGVRSVVPEATMAVRYTNTWSSYTLEKACAKQLLAEGCRVIGQHCDTVGPAIACEEFAGDAWHVGYNLDMTDVAPTASLTSTRIDWSPYVLGAVKAVMEGRPIEEVVDGRVHPNNDMSAGFDKGWVALMDINPLLLPREARDEVDDVIRDLVSGERQVFVGDYVGVSPDDEGDTVDLRGGFVENADSSIPSFHYILRDVITVEE